MLALERPGEGRATDLSAALERITTLIRKRGLVVLISDFLAPLDRLERNLIALTAGGHEVTVFQVLDPVELAFGLEKPAVFEDGESAQQIYIDPALARAAYLKKFEAHNASLRAICRKLGASFHQLSTGQALELALFEFLQARMRRGRLVRRASGGGRA
jgi:uncharacterized protein (DUF58 family)